jgi:hypothetical protein
VEYADIAGANFCPTAVSRIMKNCPICGQPRFGEEFKCPKCDVFYSQLDEILFDEREKLAEKTLKRRLKVILAAKDHKKELLLHELGSIWKNTPLKTKITLLTIFAFVFAMVVGV